MKKLLLSLIIVLLPYQLAFGAAADMAVTVAGAGDKSGTAGDGTTLEWDNAMDLAAWETDFEDNSEAGDRYFVMSGTYTLTDTFQTARNGTLTNTKDIIGVKTGTTAEPPTFDDWAFTTDRPVIAAGANIFRIDQAWNMYNLDVTTTEAAGLWFSSNSRVENCKSFNSSETADRYAIKHINDHGRVINCEGISTNGIGIYVFRYSQIIGCYAHDSDVGIHRASSVGTTVFNVIDTCTTAGILFGAGSHIVINNTLHNGGIGINGVGNTTLVILNNIIDGWTTGASASAVYGSNRWDYNNWHGNTADVSNVTKGGNATALDPTFGDEDNGDFSIGTNLKAAGFPGAFPGGLSTGYLDTGAVQREEAAAGGATANGALSVAF